MNNANDYSLHSGQQADRMPIAPFCITTMCMKCSATSGGGTFWDPPDFDPIGVVDYCDPSIPIPHTLGSVWDFGMSTFATAVLSIAARTDVTVTASAASTGCTAQSLYEHRKAYCSTQRTTAQLQVPGRSAPESILSDPTRFDVLLEYAPPGDDNYLIRRARKAAGDKGLVDSCTVGFRDASVFRKLMSFTRIRS
jgi:hypothetical protein